ncbi:hypothetical protein ACLKA6_005754 [Drosophila palustris]
MLSEIIIEGGVCLNVPWTRFHFVRWIFSLISWLLKLDKFCDAQPDIWLLKLDVLQDAQPDIWLLKLMYFVMLSLIFGYCSLVHIDACRHSLLKLDTFRCSA